MWKRAVSSRLPPTHFALIAALLFSLPATLSAQQVGFIEHPLPTAGSGPIGITAGSDGALWFTELGGKIGRITTAGGITEYVVPTAGSHPYGITAGPDGALWFTEGFGNIGRITTAGVITEYPPTTANSYPQGITAGPDGALWFTEYVGNKIGRISTAGVITEYPLLSFPFEITAGPDGALWFTEFDGNRIGRITTAGVITEYAVPTANSGLGEITAGPDGALWFTEGLGEKIGQAVFLTAVLSARPDSGVPGANVTLTGSGFASAEKVNLYADSIGANLVSMATADSGGSFVVSGPVHPASYGAHSVSAVGQSSGKVGVAPLSINPRLILTPHSGTVGSTISADGFGFGAGERVTVYWDNPRRLLGTATANSQGTFAQGAALTFTIPAGSTSGVHAAAGQGQTTQAVGTGYVTVE